MSNINAIMTNMAGNPIVKPVNEDEEGEDFIFTKDGEMIRYDEMDDVMGMKSGGAIDKLLDLARGNMSSNGNNTTTLAGSASINVNIKSDNSSLNLSGMEDKIVNVITKVFNNGGDPNSIYLATKPNAASQQTT